MMTREEAMASPSVHDLTKEILIMSENKDIVGRFHDVKLASEILEAEMRKELKA